MYHTVQFESTLELKYIKFSLWFYMEISTYFRCVISLHKIEFAEDKNGFYYVCSNEILENDKKILDLRRASLL
jgi:hypothetical protein